ncbi:MAG: metallophosphoesterase family protein, partial [Armatimonadetes bacterium]|nr:metallophosphoesterase family protein [Armatimonadota bacterium]
MKRLWIADVHANLPAFVAVLADAGAVDEVIFLGDVVGYGPHPAECVDLLARLQPQAVLGNHDAAVLALQ